MYAIFACLLYGMMKRVKRVPDGTRFSVSINPVVFILSRMRRSWASLRDDGKKLTDPSASRRDALL